MRICHITTYWPTSSFGHTHYTENLMRGMRVHQPEKHIILAAHPAAAVDTEEYQCIPCFRIDQDYVESITAAAKQARPDVALIQYSPDLFGDDNRLPRLVANLKNLGIHPVVNSHSIYQEKQEVAFLPGRTAADLDRALAEHASLMTVHSRRMQRDLLARGIRPEQVVVLPHGSKAMQEHDPGESRRRLNLPADAKVVMFFGFIWMGKGIDFLLDVFARVSPRVPEAFLFVGGHTRRRRHSTYVSYLKARAWWLGIAGRCRFWGGFVPEDMVPVAFSAADVVAMPYRQDYSSVSGVVHQTCGMGKLMICSRISKFDEIEESVDPALTVAQDDLEAWTETLVRLLTDAAWAAEMKRKIRHFAEETSWPSVGKMHLDAYSRLMKGK